MTTWPRAQGWVGRLESRGCPDNRVVGGNTQERSPCVMTATPPAHSPLTPHSNNSAGRGYWELTLTHTRTVRQWEREEGIVYAYKHDSIGLKKGKVLQLSTWGEF